MTEDDKQVEYVYQFDSSDFDVVMIDYYYDRCCPFRWYPRQKLVVLTLGFIRQVWRIGSDEPLTIDNLERAALTVAKLRFKEAKQVRVCFEPYDLRRS